VCLPFGDPQAVQVASPCSAKGFNASKAFSGLQKKFSEAIRVVLTIQVPTRDEVKVAKKMAKECPELMDDREFWVLENASDFFEDDLDEEVIE
jgi:hypothetical protein